MIIKRKVFVAYAKTICNKSYNFALKKCNGRQRSCLVLRMRKELLRIVTLDSGFEGSMGTR